MVGIGLFLILFIPLFVVGITLYVKYLCKRELAYIEEQHRARREYDISEIEANLDDYLQSSWESSTFTDGRYYADKSEPRDGSG